MKSSIDLMIDGLLIGFDQDIEAIKAAKKLLPNEKTFSFMQIFAFRKRTIKTKYSLSRWSFI